MKSQIIFFFVLWFLSQVAICQSRAVDSLQELVKKETNEVAQGRLYSEISLDYFRRQIYFDSAHYYNNKVYRIAKENAIPDLEARALFSKGIISSMLGKYEEAITHYLEAKNIYERIDSLSRVSGTYNNIGGNYFELKQYNIAIENYEKALKIALEIGSNVDVGIGYMNIGEAHYVLGRYDKAKEIIELALAAIKETDFNPPTVHLFYARTLAKLGDLNGAKKEALISYEISQTAEDLKYSSEAAQLVADIFIEENLFEEAYEYQQISFDFASRLNTAKESNEAEKLKLNFELSERNKELAHLAQRDRDQIIIYLLAGLGVLLLLVLIFRQRKIVRITHEIHTAQQDLVVKELEKRELLKSADKNATGFQAAKAQDQEL